jgi:prepilin-type N-terminal cleavage/methylation domain-containing protein
MKLKRAFTLTELLVVIAIIAMLLAILMPAMAKARLQAKIVVVNAELGNIGLALEAYGMDNGGKYPPTRAGCDTLQYWWSLPQELVKTGYMPGGKSGYVTYSKVEDKFNPGLTYKYVAVGKKYDYNGTPMSKGQSLWVADGFPCNEIKPYRKYDDPKTSPVTWVIFSLGPKFDENNGVQDNFPVSKQYWYSPKTNSGIITRVRLKDKIQHIGTFRKDN